MSTADRQRRVENSPAQARAEARRAREGQSAIRLRGEVLAGHAVVVEQPGRRRAAGDGQGPVRCSCIRCARSGRADGEVRQLTERLGLAGPRSWRRHPRSSRWRVDRRVEDAEHAVRFVRGLVPDGRSGNRVRDTASDSRCGGVGRFGTAAGGWSRRARTARLVADTEMSIR